MNEKVIVIIVVVAVVAGSLAYVLNSKSATPFNNEWTVKPDGSVSSLYFTPNSAYFSVTAGAIPLNSSQTISYQIYKVNLTSGNTEWISPEMTFRGVASQYLSTNGTSASSLGKIPELYVDNNTVYVAGFTDSPSSALPFTPGEFNVTGFSSSTGKVIFSENIVPKVFLNTSYEFLSYTTSFNGGKLYTSYTYQARHNLSSANPLSTFTSKVYDLNSSGTTLISTVSVKLPFFNGWGIPGSEGVQNYGNYLLYNIYPLNMLILQNSSTFQLKMFKTPGKVIGLADNTVYLMRQAVSTVEFYGLNLGNGQVTNIFNILDYNLNSSAYLNTAKLISPSTLIYYTEANFTGNQPVGSRPQMQTGIKMEAFSTQGRELWNITPIQPMYSPNAVSILNAGNGNMLFISQPILSDSTQTFFHFDFVTINYSNGSVVSNVSFEYSEFFTSPSWINGVFGVDNGFIIYNIDNSIAAAKY